MPRPAPPIPALLVGLAVAVALHLALLPVAAGYLSAPAPQPHPNLRLEWTQRPDGEASAGAPLDGLLRVTREAPASGGASPEHPVAVAVSLSRDGRPSGDDLPLVTLQAPSPSPVGGPDLPVAATPPADADGPWFVLAVVDPGGEVDESDETDNLVAARVWVDGGRAAAVEVRHLIAPERVAAGGTFAASYAVHNAGPGWARPNRTDRVTFRHIGNGGNPAAAVELIRPRALAPGDTAPPATVQLALPLDAPPGEYELTVTPDASGPGPGASSSTRRVTVEPATRPDLTVTDVDWPAQVTSGRPETLAFTVVNRSPVPTITPDTPDTPGTPQSLWADRVYLSADDVLDETDKPLLSQPNLAPLPGNGRYRTPPHRLTLDPEDLLSSRMYLIVSTDDGHNLDEYDEGNNLHVQPFTVRQNADPPPPDADEVKLGRADEPDRVTVAWIAHDDFQDLLARRSITHQPAVQTAADPTPDAPLNPRPAGPSSTPEAVPPDAIPPDAVSPSPLLAAATPPPAAGPPPTPPVTSTLDAEYESENVEPTASGQRPTPPAAPALGNENEHGKPAAPRREPAASGQRPAASAEGDTPTSTPRSDREADPTLTVDTETVRPGRVLVGPGLEIKTARPDFSATARVIALPANPTALITFEPDGKVSAAELTTSTGYDNVDGPILSSLYRWQATGRSLADRTEPFKITIRILLVDEPGTE